MKDIGRQTLIRGLESVYRRDAHSFGIQEGNVQCGRNNSEEVGLGGNNSKEMGLGGKEELGLWPSSVGGFSLEQESRGSLLTKEGR